MAEARPSARSRGSPGLIWAAVGVVAVVALIAVLFAARSPSDGIADTPATVSAPANLPAKPLPDAHPVTPG